MRHTVLYLQVSLSSPLLTLPPPRYCVCTRERREEEEDRVLLSADCIPLSFVVGLLPFSEGVTWSTDWTLNMTTKKAKNILKHAKGYWGKGKNCYRIAKGRVERAWKHMYVSRKLRKRVMRKAWIVQVNAAFRQYGLAYNSTMFTLRKQRVLLNRKMLAEIARTEPVSFRATVELVFKTEPDLKPKHSYLERATNYGLISTTVNPSEAITQRLEKIVNQPKRIPNDFEQLKEYWIKKAKAGPKKLYLKGKWIDTSSLKLTENDSPSSQ